jgi:hypothetical protein
MQDAQMAEDAQILATILSEEVAAAQVDADAVTLLGEVHWAHLLTLRDEQRGPEFESCWH